MKTIFAVLFCVFLIPLVVATPSPPADVVFKPTFLTGFESLTAGTGFIAQLKGESVFLTAHHLFGPASGLQRDLSPGEAKDLAVVLAASSMSHASFTVVSSEMLFIPTAKAFDERDAGHDVAGYRLRHYPGASLAVSETPPKKGDHLYLLARPRGETSLRLIRGEVTRIGKDMLEYYYNESGLDLGGTSGAPVLSEAGEVVGINIGGGVIRGKTFGFANPVIAFVPLVMAAMKNETGLAPLVP